MRFADEDRAGGRNTMTRDADIDIATPGAPAPHVCEDWPCCGHEWGDCDGTLYGSDEAIKQAVYDRIDAGDDDWPGFGAGGWE